MDDVLNCEDPVERGEMIQDAFGRIKALEDVLYENYNLNDSLTTDIQAVKAKLSDMNGIAQEFYLEACEARKFKYALRAFLGL